MRALSLREQKQVRDAMSKEALAYVMRRSKDKRHDRLRKIRGGRDAQRGVIHGAVLRLLEPPDLMTSLPKSLQKRMQRPLPIWKIGNVTLYSSPLDLPEWRAYLGWHRRCVELGSFWSVSGEEREALVDRELENGRSDYIKETRSVSPPNKKIDTEAMESLSLVTEEGQALKREPSRESGRELAEAQELDALTLRALVEAEENAQLLQAVRAYAARTESGRKRLTKHIRAINLIISSPTMKGCEIATRCRISEPVVSRLKADLEKMADAILTIEPEEVSTPEAHDTEHEIRDESVERVAEAMDSNAALDLADKLGAPEVDADISESTMQSYVRRNSEDVLGSRWGRDGKRQFSDYELTTGNYRFNEWADPALIAARNEANGTAPNHARKFNARTIRSLELASASAGVDLNATLRDIDTHIEKKKLEAQIAMAELQALRAERRLQRAAILSTKSVEELAALRVWVAPFAKALRRDIDELLGGVICHVNHTPTR